MSRGPERAVVPDAEFRSYYGRPVLKEPVWKWEIPAYLFTGGLTAGTALLAAGCDLTGDAHSARTLRFASVAGVGVSTALLTADLGRPDRVHHMLRVAKPTSPMSVGSWTLAAFAPLATAAAAAGAFASSRRAAPVVARVAGLGAAALAPLLATYTAVLVADTAVPVWHDASPGAAVRLRDRRRPQHRRARVAPGTGRARRRPPVDCSSPAASAS